MKKSFAYHKTYTKYRFKLDGQFKINCIKNKDNGIQKEAIFFKRCIEIIETAMKEEQDN